MSEGNDKIKLSLTELINWPSLPVPDKNEKTTRKQKGEEKKNPKETTVNCVMRYHQFSFLYRPLALNR